MENMTYLGGEAPPVLCIPSNMIARAVRLDAECLPTDEAEVGITIGFVAVVHAGEEVAYARMAPRMT
jgi:hypothetical protein